MNELTLDQLILRAHSIGQQEPHHDCSAQYSHIKTLDLIPPLIEAGWAPVRAVQQPCRSQDRNGYQKHMVTFRRREDVARQPHLKEDLFELHLTNSHDRTSSWTFYAGIFRLICTNGLVVSKGLFVGERLRHLNLTVENVIKASLKGAEQVKTILAHRKAMLQRPTLESERLNFAEFGLVAKYGDIARSPVSPATVLLPRRAEDEETNLWTTMNVIQENLMKGLQRDASRLDPFGRSFGPSNPINKIERQIAVNQALWGFAEGLLQTNGVNN